LSKLPDTICSPSGLNAAELTKSVCPSILCSQFPLATLHTRIVLSQLADTIFRPGLKSCEMYGKNGGGVPGQHAAEPQELYKGGRLLHIGVVVEIRLQTNIILGVRCTTVF
jgi:hypothetical protein